MAAGQSNAEVTSSHKCTQLPEPKLFASMQQRRSSTLEELKPSRTTGSSNLKRTRAISCAFAPHWTRGTHNANQTAVHDGGQITLREHSVPSRHVRNQEPRRLHRLPPRRLRGARALEPGGGRHP